MEKLHVHFEGLYRDHSQEILRYAAFRLADQARVEEVVADTFLKLWEKIQAGQTIQNPRALLYIVIRGLIIDVYRKQGRGSESILPEADLFIESRDPFAEIDENLTMKKVLSVVRGLKDEYQDIILMHYVEDMPIGDMAQIVGESENNLRVRLHRALAAVRKALI